VAAPPYQGRKDCTPAKPLAMEETGEHLLKISEDGSGVPPHLA
jgi:hypothetical protein